MVRHFLIKHSSASQSEQNVISLCPKFPSNEKTYDSDILIQEMQNQLNILFSTVNAGILVTQIPVVRQKHMFATFRQIWRGLESLCPDTASIHESTRFCTGQLHAWRRLAQPFSSEKGAQFLHFEFAQKEAHGTTDLKGYLYFSEFKTITQ